MQSSVPAQKYGATINYVNVYVSFIKQKFQNSALVELLIGQDLRLFSVLCEEKLFGVLVGQNRPFDDITVGVMELGWAFSLFSEHAMDQSIN